MYKIKSQEVVGCPGLTVRPGTTDEKFYFSVMPAKSYDSIPSPNGVSVHNLKNPKKIFYLTPKNYPGYDELVATESGKKIVQDWWKRQKLYKDLETNDQTGLDNFVVIR